MEKRRKRGKKKGGMKIQGIEKGKGNGRSGKRKNEDLGNGKGGRKNENIASKF